MRCSRRCIWKPAASPAAEPQRHRDTERNTERDIANTKTHRHEGRPPTQQKKPQITQMAADGRSPESSAWRGPGRRRTTTGDRRVGQSLRTQASGAMSRRSGLYSRRAQASPLLTLLQLDRRRLLSKQGRGRRSRRAPGASAGGKHGSDRRLRPEQTCFPPVAAIVRSPTVPPSILGTAASRRLSASICVICGFSVGRFVMPSWFVGCVVSSEIAAMLAGR